jgi:5'-deoxynucleotidase YfbR-like HD superfamily hydrolase
MSDSSWIQTYTGRKVYPLALQPSDVCIEDVAHHLARIGRFTGATKGDDAYTVAQHSVLVSIYCEPAAALWGLLHDASEAYLLDLPRPLKRDPRFAFYVHAEHDAMDVITTRFGLLNEMPASVKEADSRMLATEARDLMSPLHPEWRNMAEPYRRRIFPLRAIDAEEMFLMRFRMITTEPMRATTDAEAYR